MKTLDEFLDSKSDFPRSEYVRHPEFAQLYIRKGPIHYTDGRDVLREYGITLACIEAKKKGCGAFRRLVDNLTRRGLPIMVECVHNTRFADHLRKNGWHEWGVSPGSHFISGHTFSLPHSKADYVHTR